jgi:hypothetical protein
MKFEITRAAAKIVRKIKTREPQALKPPLDVRAP